MKIFKLMAIALVAMLGFSSCSEDCNHDFIEYDNTKNLVGTWTYLEEGQAEAMVINPDGSFEVTGVMKGGNGSLYEEKGTIKVVNNKVTLVFEGDKDAIEGRLELVAGKSLSIVLNEEYDIRLTYDYCEKDLSEEIVGMWVCTQSSHEDVEEMIIQTFKGDETLILTGKLPESGEHVVNGEINYKVFGDLLMIYGPNGEAAKMFKMTYTPNATALGDIVVFNEYLPDTDVTSTSSWLRVKQFLNLTGTYDYSSAYVSNAKGKDEDITIAGHTFNMAKIKARDFDVMFDSELFCLDLNSNSIKHYFRPNGRDTEIELPITVAGNKVTLDFSAQIPVCRKVEMYMYQDADDSQLHMYMPTTSFINYFANMEIFGLIAEGKINQTDSTAVAKVFADMEARVESINVSFVFRARK